MACCVTYTVTAVAIFGKMGKAKMLKLSTAIRDAIGFNLGLAYKKSTSRLTITNQGGNAAHHAFTHWPEFTRVILGAIETTTAEGVAFYALVQIILELYERCGRVWFVETVEEAAASGRDFAFNMHELLSLQLMMFNETPPGMLYMFGLGPRELWDYLDVGQAPYSLCASASEYSVCLRRGTAQKHLPVLGHGVESEPKRALNMVSKTHCAQHRFCTWRGGGKSRRYAPLTVLAREKKRVEKERLAACELPAPPERPAGWDATAKRRTEPASLIQVIGSRNILRACPHANSAARQIASLPACKIIGSRDILPACLHACVPARQLASLASLARLPACQLARLPGCQLAR
jgi:hypothetical protein